MKTVDPELRKLDAFLLEKLFPLCKPFGSADNPPHFSTKASLAMRVLDEIVCSKLGAISYSGIVNRQ